MSNGQKIFIGILTFIIIIYLVSNSSKTKDSTSTTTKTENTRQTETKKKQISDRLADKGDKVKTINLNKGIAIFTMNYSGSDHFSVVIKGSDGKYLGLLATYNDNYSGQKAFTVKEDGTYLVEVTAGSGKWTIDIE